MVVARPWIRRGHALTRPRTYKSPGPTFQRQTLDRRPVVHKCTAHDTLPTVRRARCFVRSTCAVRSACPCAVELSVHSPDSAARFFDGLEQLGEVLDHEEHILQPIDLERLREHGVEGERTTLASGAQRMRGIAGGGDEAAAVDLQLAIFAHEAELHGEP